MRHLRILGLTVVAAFALSAIAAVPALAKKTKEVPWSVYEKCPYNNPEVQECFAGVTSGGSKGGFFQLGGVKVPLSKSIVLHGGTHENEETGVLHLIAEAGGGETLESPELTVPGGLGLIDTELQERAHWPAALVTAFKEAKKNKETSLKVKIEVAGGNALYETENALDLENLIQARGPAFTLPLKVKMASPFLEKLGGGPCEVGNEADPIWQYLSTAHAEDGTPGKLHIEDGGSALTLTESRLGDFGWSVPEGAQASGCGGPYESYVDEAINELLLASYPAESQYWDHGLTLLAGNLYQAAAESVKEHFEG